MPDQLCYLSAKGLSLIYKQHLYSTNKQNDYLYSILALPLFLSLVERLANSLRNPFLLQYLKNKKSILFKIFWFSAFLSIMILKTLLSVSAIHRKQIKSDQEQKIIFRHDTN